jgi:hypothetical protein
MVRFVFPIALLTFAAAAQPMPRQQRPHQELSTADEKEIASYDLNQGKFDKLMRIGVKMREYIEAHPEVKNEQNPMAGKDLDESVARIESKPEMVKMLKSEGMSPREWLVCMMSFVNASMWSEATRRNPGMQLPPGTNTKNVAWVRAHPELIQKWMQTWEPNGPAHH